MPKFLHIHRAGVFRSTALALAAVGIGACASAAGVVERHLTPLQVDAAWPDWSTFQGNSAHTGYVPAKLDPSLFTTRWQIPITPVQGWLIPGVPSIATGNGVLYVSGANQIKAISEVDGSALWSHDFSDLQYPSVNPPAVSKGVVYVAAGQQESTYLFAFDAATGSQVFKSPMSSQWENYFAPTPGAYGVYTNAGTYGGLYGFKRDGSLRFFASQEQQSMWTPAVDDTAVYAYTGYLQVVDPRTGAVTHHIADDTFTNYTYEIGGSPVLGANGNVFVANYINAQLNGGNIGNTLLAFSLATDSIAWKVAGDYPTTPAYADGQLYAVNNKPFRLEVRAEAGGALDWSWSPPGGTHFVSEVLLTKNLAFVSTEAATYAINRKTHKTVWSHPLPGKLALSKAGVLYIQGADTLTAFNVQ